MTHIYTPWEKNLECFKFKSRSQVYVVTTAVWRFAYCHAAYEMCMLEALDVQMLGSFDSLY
jgi:hypothetical protein